MKECVFWAISGPYLYIYCSGSYSIPKEINLSEERSKIATSVMLISQKHYCTEHQRSCYINNKSNHLHLTPQHLSTWAASIVSFASRGAVTCFA